MVVQPHCAALGLRVRCGDMWLPALFDVVGRRKGSGVCRRRHTSLCEYVDFTRACGWALRPVRNNFVVWEAKSTQGMEDRKREHKQVLTPNYKLHWYTWNCQLKWNVTRVTCIIWEEVSTQHKAWVSSQEPLLVGSACSKGLVLPDTNMPSPISITGGTGHLLPVFPVRWKIHIS